MAVGGWYLFSNTQENLARSNIQVGFDFLAREAGFEIAESLIDLRRDRTPMLRAFLVGHRQHAVRRADRHRPGHISGPIVGIARLSENWLVRKIASLYVEVMRNVPLLLQLLVWYAFFTELLPGVRQAIKVGGLVFLSQRGLRYRLAGRHPAYLYAGIAFLVGAGRLRASTGRYARKRQERTGVQLPLGVAGRWPCCWACR